MLLLADQVDVYIFVWYLLEIDFFKSITNFDHIIGKDLGP